MMPLRPSLILTAVIAASLATAGCGGGSGATTSNDSCPEGGSGFYSEPATNSSPGVGQLIPQMPHTHVAEGTKVTYNHNPPTSGCHYIKGLGGNNPAPLAPGVYTAHIDAPYWVHNLEHGYIVVLYNCEGGGPSGCPDDFTKLRQWFGAQRPAPGEAGGQYAKVIVVPWSFDHRFAAVSWDWYDPMDTLSLDELSKFRANHVDQSPEGNASG